MRRALAAQLCLALVPALLDSSFLHTHEDHLSAHFREAHAAKGLVPHAHLGPVPDPTEAVPGPQLRSGDHDPEAKPLGWFQARQASAQPIVFEAVESPGLPTPEPEASAKLELSPRGHDPPALRSSPPRAPPA